MRILFVTTSPLAASSFGDGSTRYRCFHVAEELLGRGHHAVVQSLSQVSSRSIRRYDLVCFLRPVASFKLKRLLNTCRRFDIVTVADFDDLIFDPGMSRFSPAVVSGLRDRATQTERFAAHGKALALFHHVLVSTTPLKRAVLRLYPQADVHLAPNGLSRYWLQHCAEVTHRARKQTHQIAYLPGTRGRSRDFQLVERVLARHVNAGHDRQLLVPEHLPADASLFSNGRLVRQARVEYHKLPAIIADCSATVAPLVDSPFNRCKSHLKFIESAALGIPVICSPIDDIARHQVTGLFLAETVSDWTQALQQVTDADFLEHCKSTLVDYALTHASSLSACEALIRCACSRAPVDEYSAVSQPLSQG